VIGWISATIARSVYPPLGEADVLAREKRPISG